MVISSEMRNKHFLPAIFFGVLILVGSSLPTEKIEKLQESSDVSNVVLSDYSLHFLAFGIFAVLLCYGFYKKRYHTFSFFWIGTSSVLEWL